MFVIQTPQGFKFKDLFEKHSVVNYKNFTDDSSLFDDTSKVIKYINGSSENIKIKLLYLVFFHCISFMLFSKRMDK